MTHEEQIQALRDALEHAESQLQNSKELIRRKDEILEWIKMYRGVDGDTGPARKAIEAIALTPEAVRGEGAEKDAEIKYVREQWVAAKALIKVKDDIFREWKKDPSLRVCDADGEHYEVVEISIDRINGALALKSASPREEGGDDAIQLARKCFNNLMEKGNVNWGETFGIDFSLLNETLLALEAYERARGGK